MNTRPTALLVMADTTFEKQFGPAELHRLHALADLAEPIRVSDLDSPDSRARLAHAEVLITSWGCPTLTTDHLDAAPNLRAILHCAGSVRGLLPDDVHTRGIQVASAADLNAVPVAEFTLAAVIMAGKRAFPLAQHSRTEPAGWGESFGSELSNLGRTIGIVGFSKIGRRAVDLIARTLAPERILVSDPMADAAAVAAAGASLTTLDDLLTRSDIVSLHAPLLPQTAGMIGARELALIPEGATLINTARGGLIDHDALAARCAAGTLDAILDVTDPEPLPVDHPLLALPNVAITPHIAGSLGTETRRLSRAMLDALEALTLGESLPGAMDAATSAVSA